MALKLCYALVRLLCSCVEKFSTTQMFVHHWVQCGLFFCSSLSLFCAPDVTYIFWAISNRKTNQNKNPFCFQTMRIEFEHLHVKRSSVLCDFAYTVKLEKSKTCAHSLSGMIISILYYTFKWGNYDVSVESTSKQERERENINEQSVSNDTLRSTPKLQYDKNHFRGDIAVDLTTWQQQQQQQQ